ncbi:MarR family transcriptional regulator [Duganella sp. FT80W]|uniref:MarR family transcriptional regulator n=1 Tax=Duganella guangzhouensis TaxID=2666084 RepID=A0A6I2LAG4_9BURK|nr:MarR family transcriptional regulator [Duganella guangzhouensis]MRW93259.1 MarR family transcriptional regulator [Duganella guangzhouensis]
MARPKTATLATAVQAAADQPLDQSLLLSLVGYNCRRAYLTIMPHFEERMSKLALRAVDFSVLSILKANPNITQKRLSHAVSVSAPNLAILLDKLEQRGLVLRQRNPLDKRSQTLVLTSEGLKLCAKAETTVANLEQHATAMLTENERQKLLQLLQKIFVEGN